MSTNDETLLVKQMKELSHDLKMTSSALNNLSTQLRSLELAQKAKTSVAMARKSKQKPRVFGYVNWNSTHDILKTENWKKVSFLIDLYGKLEEGISFDISSLTKLDVVDRNTRFPEDDLYVNVNNPLVRAEMLSIELQAKTIKTPVTGLVERFLNKAKVDMHTFSSFEKKNGLKWVEPSPEVSNVVTTVPVQIPISTPDNGSMVEQVILDSRSLPEDVKFDMDRTPTTFEKKNLSEDKLKNTKKKTGTYGTKTLKLSRKFKDILRKLTPQNFDFLLEKVKALDINTQKRLEVVVDLLFEKVLKEPESSVICAALCNKLSTLKVPSDNNPDIYINFRGLIICKCQTHFETGKSDKQKKMENDLEDTNDPTKKNKLQIMIDEINTRTQMRAMANVKFIGELYKLKILTYKIIDYCMTNLIDESNEHKLECLCELLITAGKELENEEKLDDIFRKLQKIYDDKSNKVNGNVCVMVKEIIELRKSFQK